MRDPLPLQAVLARVALAIAVREAAAPQPVADLQPMKKAAADRRDPAAARGGRRATGDSPAAA